MSVKYVFVPESPLSLWPMLLVVAVSLVLIGGLIGYFLWPGFSQNDNAITTLDQSGAAAATAAAPTVVEQNLTSFLDSDTATVYVVDNIAGNEPYAGFLSDQIQQIGKMSQENENSQAALILFGTPHNEILPLDTIDESLWEMAATQVGRSMGGTSLFAATSQGLTLLEGVPPEIDRRLVVITDGAAQNPTLTDQLVASANNLGVRINAIAVGDINEAYIGTLQDLSVPTGGRFYDWRIINQPIN